jgi:hypothetical protein
MEKVSVARKPILYREPGREGKSSGDENRFQGFKVSRFQSFKVSAFQCSRFQGFRVSRLKAAKPRLHLETLKL